MGIEVISSGDTSPPNPDPLRYSITQAYKYTNAYVLIVVYKDCTNYEGKKILVFRGELDLRAYRNNALDPHFLEGSNLLARFVPTDEGLRLACFLAEHWCEVDAPALIACACDKSTRPW